MTAVGLKRKKATKAKKPAVAKVQVEVTVRPAPAKEKEILLAVVLDESGSMDPRRSQVISGFNEYVDGLRRQKGMRYRVSLTKFNTSSWPVYTARALAEVPALDFAGYTPGGGTALVDAVCDTIKAIDAGIGLDGVVRPVLVLIMTDGEENSSRRWNSATMRELIRGKEASGTWTFVYLGADQNAWGNAQQYGFQFGNVIRYDSAHTHSLYSTNLTAGTQAFARSVKSGATATGAFANMAGMAGSADENADSVPTTPTVPPKARQRRAAP